MLCKQTRAPGRHPNGPATLKHFIPTIPPLQKCSCTQDNVEGTSAGSLVLRLVGLARTRIVRSNSTNHQTSRNTVYSAKDEFLSFDIQLASFGGRAAACSQSFPFSVMLPPGLPSSMKVRGGNSEMLSNAFVRAAP